MNFKSGKLKFGFLFFNDSPETFLIPFDLNSVITLLISFAKLEMSLPT